MISLEFFEYKKFIEELKEAIWKGGFCDIDRIEVCLAKPHGYGCICTICEEKIHTSSIYVCNVYFSAGGIFPPIICYSCYAKIHRGANRPDMINKIIKSMNKYPNFKRVQII